MGNLINVAKLEEGGDPLTVWETVNQIIDALNDITITIIPGELASAVVNEGDIQINFHPNTVPESPASSSQLGGGADDGGSAPGG